MPRWREVCKESLTLARLSPSRAVGQKFSYQAVPRTLTVAGTPRIDELLLSFEDAHTIPWWITVQSWGYNLGLEHFSAMYKMLGHATVSKE